MTDRRELRLVLPSELSEAIGFRLQFLNSQTPTDIVSRIAVRFRALPLLIDWNGPFLLTLDGGGCRFCQL